MDAKIILKSDSADVKNPLHLKNNVFLLYARRKIKIEPMAFQRIDSGILAFVPKNANGFVTSKVRENKINEVCTREQCLWVEIVNKSCSLPIKIPKCHVLGFFVAEPEHLQFQHETLKKIKKATREKGKKTLSWKKKKTNGRIPELL